MIKIKRLTEKQKKFCRYYAALHNGRAAACKAGFPVQQAESAAATLLLQPSIREEIVRLEAEGCRSSPLWEARAGLRQIAFGSATDIVRLLLESEDGPPPQLEELDLYLISEMKKPKGGGLEVKLFDRTKALELLMRLPDYTQAQDGLATFYRALEEGAAALTPKKTDG